MHTVSLGVKYSWQVCHLAVFVNILLQSDGTVGQVGEKHVLITLIKIQRLYLVEGGLPPLGLLLPP